MSMRVVVRSLPLLIAGVVLVGCTTEPADKGKGGTGGSSVTAAPAKDDLYVVKVEGMT
jgi:hypothetical protein